MKGNVLKNGGTYWYQFSRRYYVVVEVRRDVDRSRAASAGTKRGAGILVFMGRTWHRNGYRNQSNSTRLSGYRHSFVRTGPNGEAKYVKS